MPILHAEERLFGARIGLIVICCFIILTHMLDSTLADSLSIVDLTTVETRVLKMGHERKQEKLPLRGGRGKCVYELVDLRESYSYEVKISYPATIPSRFSLSLAKKKTRKDLHLSRRLLNTEKVIFEVDRENVVHTDGLSFTALVLVTVESEGVVSKAQGEEQEFVIYNIRLEEVRWGGIPVQAFWVGFLGLTAIALSIMAAHIFPSLLETEKDKLIASKQALS